MNNLLSKEEKKIMRGVKKSTTKVVGSLNSVKDVMKSLTTPPTGCVHCNNHG